MNCKSLSRKLLITCEHGGNDVPIKFRKFFTTVDAKRTLRSHRGYDPGALLAARKLAADLQAPLVSSTISRLVVDLNRSLDSNQLFSKFVAQQGCGIKQRILDAHYLPYRRDVINHAQHIIDAGHPVLHLSIHTFTPRYCGANRKFDIGVLFDPQRSWENRFGNELVCRLASRGLRTIPNQPYLGTDDGLTTAMRELFKDSCYAGIELELNNRIAKRSENFQATWCQKIKVAIEESS